MAPRTEFEVITDHKNLQHFMTTKLLSQGRSDGTSSSRDSTLESFIASTNLQASRMLHLEKQRISRHPRQTVPTIGSTIDTSEF